MGTAATLERLQLPTFLQGTCDLDAYRRWLHGRAAAHVKRDRKRGNTTANVSTYKAAIHAAVIASDGKDTYTGLPLRWDLISKYDNLASKEGRRAYKKQFADLPSVDHVGDGLGPPTFRICSWQINDAKNDLDESEFVKVCQAVMNYQAAIRADERPV